MVSTYQATPGLSMTCTGRHAPRGPAVAGPNPLEISSFASRLGGARAPSSPSRRHPSVDGDHLAGDVAGGGAGEAADHVGDVGGVPQPADGDALLDLGLDLLG